MRRALQQKYRWLFVDEFQDTDPVQAEIVFLAAPKADGRRVEARAQQAESGQTGAACRSAQARCSSSATRSSRSTGSVAPTSTSTTSCASGSAEPRSGEVLPLTMNFRSVPALCDVGEHRVRDALSDGADGARAAVRAARSPNRRSRTFAASVVHADAPLRQWRRRRSGCWTPTGLRAYIRSEVDAGRRHFGDFLILTRKKNDRIAPYAARARGAEHSGRSERRRRVRRIARRSRRSRCCCARSADPQDARRRSSACCAGRSSASATPSCSRSRRPAAGSASSVRRRAGTGNRLRPTAATRVRLGARRPESVLPLDAHASRRLPRSSGSSKHTGYLALAATTPGGVEAGDRAARRRPRAPGRRGRAAASPMRLTRSKPTARRSSEVESLPLEPGRSDVVRLMNLHKAKGLEATVVFLADPCGGVKPRVDVRIVRDGLSARGYFSITTRVGPRREGAGRACRLGPAQAEEQTVSRGGGASAALRGRHPRPRPARRRADGRRAAAVACVHGRRSRPS